MSNPKIIVGVSPFDDPQDVDEAYGAGTYKRLYPDCDECGCRMIAHGEKGCDCGCTAYTTERDMREGKDGNER